jgi:hypothetical protein
MGFTEHKNILAYENSNFVVAAIFRNSRNGIQQGCRNQDITDKNQLAPQRNYNFDETGISVASKSKSKIIS